MDTLQNGATLIAQIDSTVLAKLNGQFVTWKIDSEGNCYWGHYFTARELAAAINDFNLRAACPGFARTYWDRENTVPMFVNETGEAYCQYCLEGIDKKPYRIRERELDECVNCKGEHTPTDRHYNIEA
jgi:hypothetical protein